LPLAEAGSERTVGTEPEVVKTLRAETVSSFRRQSIRASMVPTPARIEVDRIDALRSLVQVFDSGNYTAAADALRLHKATVSQHVRVLERHFGVRLFTRTTRSITPTPEGRSLHEHATRILQQVEAAELALRPARSTATGHLRIEAPVALGRFVLAPALPQFLSRHPGLTVEFGCADTRADLVRQGVDCAIRSGAMPDSTLVCRTLGALRFGLYTSLPYVQRAGLPSTPDDLVRHALVIYRPSGAARPAALQLWRTSARDVSEPVPLAGCSSTTDSGFALQWILAGGGIGLLSEFVAASVGSSLVRVLPAWHGPTLPLHLVTTSARHRLARVRAFLEWAETTLREHLGSHLVADSSRGLGPPDRSRRGGR
jgi:LysR family transcriptional regulator for bpeEF and oprC